MTNRVAVVVIAIVVFFGLLFGMTVIPPAVSDLVDSVGDDGGPDEVVATNGTMHLDRVGRPTVVGEVANGLSVPVENVSVEITYLHEGDPVLTVSDEVLGSVIAAGGTAPFVVHADDLDVRPDEYEVAISYEEADEGPTDSLAITDAELTQEAQDQIVVVGAVENRGNEPLDVSVVATFYDENGSVIGVRMARPAPGTLEPDRRADFEVRFRTLGDVPSRARDFADFEIQAYVRE